MAVVGPGITIGPGITFTPPVATMRNLLSSSGQTAYDSTTVGNWFNVSSTDYAAVFSGLSGVSKYGLTDSQLTTGAQAWSANYAQAWGAGLNAQLATGTYVIGFVSRTNNSTGSITPLISTALPTSGTYSAIANSATVSVATGALQYYLRRAPTAVASTSYLGIVGNVNMTTNTTITGVTNWYSSTGLPYTAPWTAYNGAPIIFQALGTSTYQWS